MVIVELRAKPGRRTDLVNFIDNLVQQQGPDQAGFLGGTRYGVIDDPDRLIEIADWESAEARDAHLRRSAASGAYAPLSDLLAEPFRATIVRRLHEGSNSRAAQPSNR